MPYSLAEVPPYLIAGMLLAALVSLPHRHRPAGSIAAAFLLLLAEPSRGPHGERLAGPCTALAVFTLIGVAFVLYDGSWRHLHDK